MPWLPHTAGTTTAALVELIDLLPTMSDLAGLPHPVVHPGEAPLDGASQIALFGPTPPASVNSHVLTQHPRCPTTPALGLWDHNLCIEVPAAKFGWMGYSLRTDRWRYTAWFPWNGTALAPVVKPGPPANGTRGFYCELYGYPAGAPAAIDDLDLVEMGPANPDVVATLHNVLVGLIR